MKTILIILFCLSGVAQALEIDEKLTVRVVKTSESRKTIMVNRGTEDGLVEGDHAKFIVTAGIVARAVCVRVSPTRSVWSVYRLVNADFILNDSVMSLKISAPVKITKDESQALVQEDTPTKVSGDATTLGIPLADGAQDINVADEKLSQADLKSLEESNVASSLVEQNMEVFSVLNISGLTANSKSGAGGKSYTNSQAFHHIGLGGEFYSQREREWFSKFSLLASVDLMRENNQAYNGAGSTNDITEFSFGTNWHPFKMPSLTGDFIPFFHASFHFGMVKSSFNSGAENTVTPQKISASGATLGGALGFGYKFYTHKGYGARILLDYYWRAEEYKTDNSDPGNTHSKTVAGPRLMLGLSYRF